MVGQQNGAPAALDLSTYHDKIINNETIVSFSCTVKATTHQTRPKKAEQHAITSPTRSARQRVTVVEAVWRAHVALHGANIGKASAHRTATRRRQRSCYGQICHNAVVGSGC